MNLRVGVHRVLTAALLLSGVAACGGTSSTANTAADDAVTTVGAGAVPELLQFTAPLVGGGEFVGAAYAGRATAFWFWAPT